MARSAALARRDPGGRHRVHPRSGGPRRGLVIARRDRALLLERGPAEVEARPAARLAGGRDLRRLGLFVRRRALVDPRVVRPVRVDRRLPSAWSRPSTGNASRPVTARKLTPSQSDGNRARTSPRIGTSSSRGKSWLMRNTPCAPASIATAAFRHACTASRTWMTGSTAGPAVLNSRRNCIRFIAWIPRVPLRTFPFVRAGTGAAPRRVHRLRTQQRLKPPYSPERGHRGPRRAFGRTRAGSPRSREAATPGSPVPVRASRNPE